MKSDLAEELLDALMGWERAAFQEKIRSLEALATYKFDEYDNFRPGVKFFESLAAWLNQLEQPGERATALDFVIERLIFVSDAEMTHLIELVYPDHVEPVLRHRAAERMGVSRFEVSRIVGNDAFVALRRRSLVLGASDGARLDRLRRSAPALSHEQFLQGAEPAVELIEGMRDKLAEGLQQLNLDYPPTFEHVFLVDDFAGSGVTMFREEEDGTHAGKLNKLAAAIDKLREQELVSEDVDVTIVLYVASEQAYDHLQERIATSLLPAWDLRVVQQLPAWVRVDNQDAAFASLCERYYDKASDDKHKGRVPLGYTSCALPVVLSHNTPNNSVSLLWADTTEVKDSLQRHALFPRYERHHRDRP